MIWLAAEMQCRRGCIALAVIYTPAHSGCHLHTHTYTHLSSKSINGLDCKLSGLMGINGVAVFILNSKQMVIATDVHAM